MWRCPAKAGATIGTYSLFFILPAKSKQQAHFLERSRLFLVCNFSESGECFLRIWACKSLLRQATRGQIMLLSCFRTAKLWWCSKRLWRRMLIANDVRYGYEYILRFASFCLTLSCGLDSALFCGGNDLGFALMHCRNALKFLLISCFWSCTPISLCLLFVVLHYS